MIAHRLRRPAEGGVLARRPLRDAAALDRVGRHRRAGRERARGRRPRRARRSRRRRPDAGPSGRRSTATGTPRSGSRPPSSLRLPAPMSYDVAIVGAGYVGVPLAQVFAEAGSSRRCSSTSTRAASSALNRGESYIEDVPSETLAAARRRRRLARDDRLRRPARGGRDPDRAPDAALASSASPTSRSCSARPRRSRKRLRKGHLVVLESTTYPGTTREEVLPILEAAAGSKAGDGLPPRVLARARRPGPHRLDDEERAEGRRRHHRRVHRARGGAVRRARSTPSHRVSSPEAAELTKLLENIFRSVNIALVNELAHALRPDGHRRLGGRRRGGDEAVRLHAASSPGPGLGGHCIPIDPFYLTWKAREFDFYDASSSSSPARSTRTCRTTAARSSRRR